MLLPVVVLPLLVVSAMATSPVRPVHFGPGPVIPAPGVLGPVRPGPKTGPPSNAPSCPKDEHYVVDTNLCEKTCDNRFIYNVMGPCQPFSKCVCNNGLVRLNRDATGPCIPENECPCRSRCGYNEEWTKKKYACPPEVCESRYKLYMCTDEERIPREGCQCIDGHLRNSSNICIPTESCPPRVPTQTQKCGYNEEWAEDRIPCPPESCWTLYMQPPCAPPPPDRPPNPGCKCIDGYLRNDDNVCIPKAKCPPPLPKCPGPNEVARAKKIQCPPQTCESIYTTYNCEKTKEEPGCDCIDGFLRNATGICIPSEECPPASNQPEQCGPNEEWVADRPYCPVDKCFATPCAPVPPGSGPNPGCQCMDGYLRNNDNICVPKDQCNAPSNGNQQPQPNPVSQPQQCGPNEEWVADRPYCPVDKCFATPCAPVPPGSGPNPGCQCMDGYLRNNDNVCVPKDQCNAPSNGNQQPQPQPPQPKPVPQPQPPQPKPTPQPQQCGPNEEWVPDRPYCPIDKCFTPPCAPVPPGSGPNPGCQCMSGYLRNNDNICVPKDQCNAPWPQPSQPNPAPQPQPPRPKPMPQPQQCGPNEEWVADRPYCPVDKCFAPPCAPVPPGSGPNPGCQCMDGYLRNNDNVCVPKDQCNAPQPQPQPGQCGPNEEWVADRPYCPVDNCFATPCAPVPPGSGPNPGCICRNGYLRNNNNMCVTRDQCNTQEPVCTGPNEEPTSDVYSCPPKTCRSLNMAFICLPDRRPSPQPGCQCIEGYFRNDNNVCVLPEQCPGPKPICGYNEVYTDTKRTCPPESCAVATGLIAVRCADEVPQPGCVCKEGHARNSSDICIPIGQCPPGPLPICGDNEVYTDRKRTCPPQSCEAASGFIQYLCAYEEPKPGCICRDGYVRDKNEVCIPVAQCPPGPVLQILCGPNEVETDRKITCPPQTCEAIGRVYKCPPQKLERGCNCIDGYLRNAKNECIPKEQCKKGGIKTTTAMPPTRPPGKKCQIAEVCRRTCAQRENPDCVPIPAPEKNVDGCQCKPGYILESVNGKCIREQDCPKPTCPPNEYFALCKVECPLHYCPVNDIPLQGILICDPPNPCPSGCTCQPGFLRKSYEEPICIEAATCPRVNCTRPNEVWNRTPPTCLAERCEDAINPPGPCLNAAPNYVPRCTCLEGYYRNASNICVPANQCPGYGKCDKNAVYKECPSACPATCESPTPPRVCNKMCLKNGCECKPGFVLHEGKCIEWKDCPRVPCPANETYAFCKAGCPTNYCPTSDSLAMIACSPPYPCPPGCVCEGGYKRRSYDDPSCIKYSECPPVTCTRPNEEWNPTPPNCIADRCSDLANPQPCNRPYPNYNPQCMCKKGFYRNDDNICVPPTECHITCPANKTLVNCDIQCPTETCPENDRRAYIACDPPYPCPPGCVCQAGYLYKSSKDRDCIKASECPPVQCTRQNEEWVASPPTCIRDRCEDAEDPQPCDFDIPNFVQPPQCMCKPGFYRNELEICVPVTECPGYGKCDKNSTFKVCPSACPATCESPTRPEICIQMCLKDGCECKSGFVLHQGKCIDPKDCPPPVNCTRPNEVWDPSPSGCIRDRCDDVLNTQPCDWPYPNDPQCVCKPDHYRNGSDICVPVMQCGITCPANKTFVYCNAGCPTDTCPESDSRAIIACDPPYPCPHGCACQAGYLHKSSEDRDCIKSSECPPVQCTRQNEEWVASPPNCIRDRCEDAANPQPCDWDYPQPPQCMCKPGFYRNASEICVPVAECPCSIPANCRATCAVPNPKNCPAQPITTSNIDGCQCKAGYVLSEADGKCIRIEECPENQGCNGDEHAIIMACPWACPSTCDSPQASNCDRPYCEKPVGCVCQSGYIYSKKAGKCILPEYCPGGNPCGPNATFSDCGFRCPNQYCPQDDSGVVYACKPGRPCPPGCVCNINHLRLNYEDDRCIVASECPPVKCTRPNEVWDSCPSECGGESCDNVNDPPVVCNTLLLNCQPKCVCQKDHYRNSDGICVPYYECPIPPNTCTSDCAPTCAVPNPPNCPLQSEIKKPCCESGFILDKKGGKCIPIEECPKTGCNGDPNAVVRRCPVPCVPSTCAKPEAQLCPTPCTPGCECGPGYILSKIGGKCIKVDQCPKGNPCGANATFVNCKSSCPTDYCPTDDSRATVICETYPFAPCVSGCRCNLNHKLNNRKQKKCIVSSECPPVKCTRPNEVWDSCPSACLSEYCDAAYEKPVVCNTLVLNCDPRCVCQKGFFRNEKDICIPRKQCPKPKRYN